MMMIIRMNEASDPEYKFETGLEPGSGGLNFVEGRTGSGFACRCERADSEVFFAIMVVPPSFGDPTDRSTPRSSCKLQERDAQLGQSSSVVVSLIGFGGHCTT